MRVDGITLSAVHEWKCLWLHANMSLMWRWSSVLLWALFYSGSSNDSSCFDIFTQFVSCADPTGCGYWTQFISMGLSGAWRKLICCLHYCCSCRRVQRWHCLVSPTMWLTCSLRLYTILLLIVLIAGVWLRGETGPGLNYGAMVNNV